MFSISPEITVGNIFTAGSFIIGGVIFILKIQSKVDLIANTLSQSLNNFERRLGSVERSINSLDQAFIQLAKQEARLDAHAQRLSDLEHSDEKWQTKKQLN